MPNPQTDTPEPQNDTPEPQNATLMDLIERSVDLHADCPALAFVGQEPLTYREFYGKIEKTAAKLRKIGVNAGDKVALLSESMPHWGIAYFAVIKIGGIVVPILPDFHPNQINHIIRHAECKRVFVSGTLYEKLIERKIDTVDTMILIESFRVIPDNSTVEEVKGLQSKEEEDEDTQPDECESATLHPDDTACILYTSGTSGRSKGVMLTHKNLITNAVYTDQIIAVGPGDRFLSILPLSHTYEFTVGFLQPIRQGCVIYYLSKPPTARVLLPALAEVKPTAMLSIPLIIEKIYRLKVLPELTKSAFKRKLYSFSFIRKQMHKIAGSKLKRTFGGELKLFGIGGSALSPDVEKFLREANFPYAIGYGATETSPLIAGGAPKVVKFRSTGPPFRGVELKIDNPDAETGEGEILVKGGAVMKGYYRDEEGTKAVFTEDGWYKTGDLGVLDEDRFLYIKGRLKNMIVGPSGENIYPEEIECFFYENNNVVEAIVYESKGNLVARVHLDYEKIDEECAGKNMNESDIKEYIGRILEEIRDHVNNNVPRYCRINKTIEQTEPFEKTPTKKIKRYLFTE